jgi:hypothetical protein
MLLCGAGGELAPAAHEAPRATTSEEGDQCSSYGTDESEPDEGLEMGVQNSGDQWTESVDVMKRSLAALDATQHKIVEKLSTLEKVVNVVQEDTSWMRGDVQVVHQVVEKLSDYVSVLSDTVAVVEGVPTKKSPLVSAWGHWKEEALPKERGSTQQPGIGDDDELHAGDEERNHMQVGHDGDTAIAETQMYENTICMERNTGSLASETEDGGWDKSCYTGRTLALPTEEQPGGDDEDEHWLAGRTQVEMTINCTQSGTQTPGRSIWSDFASTVRDMAGPLHPDVNSSEGWVQSKRGRASSSEVGTQSRVQSLVENMTGHTNFNLNMSPNNSDLAHTVCGRGLNSASRGRGAGSRGGGRGGGRGAGRGKKPPASPATVSHNGELSYSTPSQHCNGWLFRICCMFPSKCRRSVRAPAWL